MSADELRAEMGKLVLREGVNDAIEELSKRVLHDAKAIELGDELYRAAHGFVVASVNKGPYDCDEEATLMIRCLERYREARGL
jgi:hypothetical protein